MQEQLKNLTNTSTVYSTEGNENKPAHKGNSQIIKNKSGEFVHPVAKITKRFLHKIR